ncbi:Fic family protein [Gilliamella sp. Pas-s95]|uniref:Fic family protein n=1 Tax=Gilliamella sp. Pas-s95 TaxID=2687317 RepID=UPI00132A82AA|nr:Fic family protein [Gilliamella sp. Pas-s95]MWN05727.1 HTH domain-containing protein [Gilliamella sp. Pas-s95]
MSKYSPPYNITPAIINSISEISELLGHWSATGRLASPQLRKENRIRTIQASLAIEHNSLSIEQVTAIMDGKHVLGPVRDVQEVRNAILAYERLLQWNSGNIKHFQQAHKLLTKGLVEYSGNWRNSGVGIYRENQLIHMAPQAERVPILMQSLFDWLNQTDIHPLIKSCIFHYELEFIHPFSDGNGRMGRLWQTLILSEWRKELAWLPVETLVCENQEKYYQVLGEADRAGDCTCFIDFMLQTIASSLKASITDTSNQNNVGENDGELSEKNNTIKITQTAKSILKILKNDSTATITDLSVQLGVSTRTIERNLKQLQEQGLLKRLGSATKAGYWSVISLE